MAVEANTVQQRRRELLRRRIAETGLNSPSLEKLPTLYAGQRYALSDGQRRMWFVQTLDPDDTTLNICVAYDLDGDLDRDRLRSAVEAVAARHSVLRTRYGTGDDGEPYQVFTDDATIGWRYDDTTIGWRDQDRTGAADDDTAAVVDTLVRDEFDRPFDLAADAPLRCTLIRTAVTRHVLVVVVHHICWDDDCWAVFFDEVNAAYGTCAAGPLEDAPPQFIAAGVLTAAPPEPTDVDYWRSQFDPPPEPLELPGPPVTGSPSRRATQVRRTVSPHLLSRVEECARAHSATPFMVLLAAFGALTARYSGTHDMTIAVPVVDRPGPARRSLGYFGNTLLLRLAGSPQASFATLLDSVRRRCLDGFAHQGLGIDRVVREINPDRTAGTDGLSQLARLGFSMRSTAGGFALDGVTTRILPLGAATAQVPLALAVVTDPDAPMLELEYQTDVMSGPLVEQMLEHYVRLLEQALDAPTRPLADITLLDADERTTVLAQARGERVDAPATTMVAVLEAAAAARPDTVAVIADTAGAATRLTYRELHARANRLARWLVDKGVGTETVVALQMNGSVEFVVAVLAVWKAGAAYLPIDPAYPHERVDYLVRDTNPHMVIGAQGLAAAEAAAAGLSAEPLTDADRLRPLRPANLAYVIYTSGSTGRPKGVAVPHEAIAEHIEGFTAQWTMTAEDRMLQSSSVSFDASLADLFLTLSLGAQLVIPEPGRAADVDYIAEVIDRHDVTVLHMVPAMLSTLLALPHGERWRRLRLVPVGGEALPGSVADEFTGRFGAQLRNHYGPTEAVVCSTHKPVDRRYGAAVVPIGAPNRNVDAYVLDARLQPVPADVVGELYLGGAQLARCYVGSPGLTAQRFVADPFTAGARLYRTGDLVRRTREGDLEFVGRADEQVKVRGYRIELGEVEAVLSAHPAVSRSVVVTETTPQGPRLAAYLVPAAAVDVDDLRAHAAQTLPDYMLPSAYAVIPEIPLTVHGKLDRRALPTATRVAAAGYRAPATATERRLCALFEQLFGGETVGAHDSFFELGGHSLLAARLVASIRAEFGLELAVRTVFDAPTPAGLAARLTAQFRADFDLDLDELADELGDELADGDGPGAGAQADIPAPAGRPALAAGARPSQVPLSYSQLAAWLHYRMEGAHPGFNMPCVLRIDGPIDAAVLTDALDDVIARHDALRTNFAEHDGVPYQHVHPHRSITLGHRRVGADRLDETVTELRDQPLTPETDVLLRATLLDVDDGTHVLVVIVHHLICDHTSLGVIVDDLIEAYRARHRGDAPRWSTPTVHFADYALWQRDAFDSPTPWGATELAHWRDALAGLPEEISIAPDRCRQPIIGTRAQSAAATVPADLRNSLVRLAEQAGVTEFMVYQAAIAVVLHTLGGGTDVPVGSPVASRVDPATANLVGLFANVVVLRNDLSGDPELKTVLARSRDTVLDAFEHQEVPIERVVETLKPVRSRLWNPLYQHMIHFQGEDWALTARELTDTGETTVTPLPFTFDMSLLDLDFSMTVSGDGALSVRVVGNADLYDPPTVERIVEALTAALAAFVANPATRLSQLQLLPADVVEQLLDAPDPTPAPAPAPTAGSERTEQILIALLGELLEITDIDREDNFFAVGGDSVIAVQWAARAAAHELTMSPVMVFEHLTIAELAAAVDAAGAAGPDGADDAASAAPLSASGLDPSALAALTASWQQHTQG
ncbi:non-ribosomal peptide synthetase [Mycolicibacillus koreensis]|nr:non-ribosomal peptide synthetase [Mycolicibacillus koreensis]